MVGVLGQDAVVEGDRRQVIAHPAQHDRLEVAGAGVAGLVGQQAVDLFERLLGLVGPVQHHGVVLPGGLEPRGELEAASQQGFRVVQAAQARRHFGQHADGGDVGGAFVQLGAQQALGFGNAVADQGVAGRDQARVAGGVTGVHRVGPVGTGAVADGAKVVAEDAPSLGVCRRQGEAGCQPAQRLGAPAGPAQQKTQRHLRRAPAGVLLYERMKGGHRLLGLAAGGPCLCVEQQGGGMRAGLGDDFLRLGQRQRGGAIQQPGGMRQRLIQRGRRTRGDVHVAFAPPDACATPVIPNGPRPQPGRDGTGTRAERPSRHRL